MGLSLVWGDWEEPKWHYPEAKLWIQVETGSQEPMLASTCLVARVTLKSESVHFYLPKPGVPGVSHHALCIGS